MATFFLGVGNTRISNYQEARTFFARNLHEFRKKNSIAAFFAWQGLAFFRFFCGEFQKTVNYAERAAALANKLDFVYGQVIALDLLAHASVQTGQVRRGLKLFQEALSLARKIGNGGIEAAIQMALLRFRAMHGIEPTRAVRELRYAVKKLRPTDTYSLAEINLELIRQLILLGKASEAEELLRDSYDLVYENRNLRQSATLNLRVAYLQYLRGDLHQARHFLRTAKLNLDPKIDRLQSAPLEGLEIEIQEMLGSSSDLDFSKLRQFDGAINQRILARKEKRAVGRPGEDPLGDLLDRISMSTKKEELIDEVIDSGFLGLLPRVLDVNSRESRIVLGFKGRKLLLIDRGDVDLVSGLTGIQAKILGLLSKGEVGKEELVTQIWGYQYDPLRHDSLVYSAISKLRASLKWASRWIESTDYGYRLSPHVKVTFFGQETGKKEKTAKIKQKVILNPELNIRQNLILESLLNGSRSFWNQKACREEFNVSTMTATRDLAEMVKRGIIRRVGRGRATVYVLEPKGRLS